MVTRMVQGSLPLPSHQLPPSSHSAWRRDSTSCLSSRVPRCRWSSRSSVFFFCTVVLVSAVALVLGFFSHGCISMAESVGLLTQSSLVLMRALVLVLLQ